MILLLLAVATGFAVGAPLSTSAAADRLIRTGTTALILLVVLVQGAALGADPALRSTLLPLAAQAALLTAALALCTVALVEPAARALGFRHVPAPGDHAGRSWRQALTTATALVAILGLGLAAGAALEHHAHTLTPWRDVPLLGLLAFIGADLGRRRAAVARELRRAGPLLLLGPVAIAATLAGTLLALPWLPHSPNAIVAGGLGFGFYSVSGPMITSLDGPAAGGVVFLANLFRELSAMVLVPLMARAGLSAPTAAAWGGATAMDSTLPFLTRSYGSTGAASGLALGILLSIAVPAIIPIAYAVVPG